MISRRGLFGLAAGAAVAGAFDVPEAEAEDFPPATEMVAIGRVTATHKRYATVDVGTDKDIYVSPMTQAHLDLDLKVGDKVEVTWEELGEEDEPLVLEAYDARLA